MQNKSEIINYFKKKLEILKKHNHYYYNKDNPKISDQEYDELKKELIILERDNDFLKKLKLLSNIVGAKPSNRFSKIPHLQPMLSLSNAFDKNDMGDFLKR